ncbi:MAG: ATPase [Hasllibacter sp.]
MDMSARAVMAPPPLNRPLDSGLDMTTMRDLVLKTIFRTNIDNATALSKKICMPVGATQELIDLCRDQQLLEAMGTMSATQSGEMTYRLSDLGKARAQDALAQSEYFGAFPVPLEVYKAQAKRQSIRDVPMTRDKLTGAMGHLILPGGLIDQLGPAVGSGRSILMYGPPGNGKSSISNGIRDAIGDTLYVPHAILYQGQIITVFDPIVHTPVPEEEEDASSIRKRSGGHDRRYVHCERPVVITGGELRVDMLNLTYNPVARTYQAPLQLKSTGGVFIIDDLGRQEEPPQAIVNRWIVPLEESKDILALQSGEKFEVPFDTLVVFSTNFHPNEIFDGAALRRIFYKIKIDGPDQEGFLKIFALVAKKKGVPLDQDSLIYLLKTKYPTIDNNFANYQPVFLVDQLIAICDFEGIPYQMRPDLLDRAWANMFVKQEEIAH